MKQFFALLAVNILPIILALLACYMVYADKDGWGWVLFAAILITAYPKSLEV
jgi:hypothetical protein